MQNSSNAIFILVNGGTASGKTTVCEQIVNGLGDLSIRIISMDNFYKTPKEEEMQNIENYNFDHPDAFDWDLMVKCLEDMKKKIPTQIPLYSFIDHKRLDETVEIEPVDILIFEGILSPFDKRIREMSDLIIFVDTDSDLRLMRRITRDIKERGRSLEGVLSQYKKTVKPSFEMFCAPLKRFAHVIIPHGQYNPAAINLLRLHLKQLVSMKHSINGEEPKIGVKTLSDGSSDYCLFEK